MNIKFTAFVATIPTANRTKRNEMKNALNKKNFANLKKKKILFLFVLRSTSSINQKKFSIYFVEPAPLNVQ